MGPPVRQVGCLFRVGTKTGCDKMCRAPAVVAQEKIMGIKKVKEKS